jgi:hypothetical protein
MKIRKRNMFISNDNRDAANSPTRYISNEGLERLLDEFSL